MAIAIVDRRALRRNLQRLRELAPGKRLIAIVKANSYGHGLLETAKTLQKADAFGVSHLDEALQLREGGIVQPILLLEGFLSSKDLPIIATQRLQTIVHNTEQLQALESAKLSEPIVVWMKLDTGMHRLGIHLEYGEVFYQRLSCCKNVQHPVNILSHFSRADELECNVTEQQINRFGAFCKGKPGFCSIAASSGILFWPKSHFDYVRPGIILYGISPLKGKSIGEDFGFQPVMSFTSSLIAVRKHKAGEPVSYGGTWISKRDTFLGVVAVGYGDGYPHAAPSGTPVLVNNREVSIVGRVTMDMICVNLGQKTKDKIGDPVVLWGKKLPIERISQIIGVSAYELTTRLTSRVITRFLN